MRLFQKPYGYISILKKLILKLTHRTWNSRISSILCREFHAGTINSKQLHILASKFDPTQDHSVY